MILKFRKAIILIFILLCVISILLSSQIKFNFSFDQFFPEGDQDLEFYNQFKKDFEPDDNFLLIAIKNEPSVFDSSFLAKFHSLSIEIKSLSDVKSVQSPTLLQFPVKIPFGYTLIPFIHIDEPAYYESDKNQILNDARFVNNMIDSASTSLVIVIKIADSLDIKSSDRLIAKLNSVINSAGFKDKSHILGKINFQTEIVSYQKKEVLITSLLSLILVSLVFLFIYKRPKLVFIALASITVGLVLFIGYLGLVKAELNLISALFPVILLIVGSSDVIHILTKYIEEIKRDHPADKALALTIHEVGIPTLLTSVTTAIGFLTLGTSRLASIQFFGFHAAFGVILAFVTAILFLTSLITYIDKKDINIVTENNNVWTKIMNKINNIVLNHEMNILKITVVLTLIFGLGLFKISTNYTLRENLPIGSKILEDFDFFEKNYSGFRPMEFAITIKNDSIAIDDFKVVSEINKIEDKVTSSGLVRSSFSLSTLYKSINGINYPERSKYDLFPQDEKEYQQAQKLLNRIKTDDKNILISTNNKKTRISTKLKDVGADSIRSFGLSIDQWISSNIDTTLISAKRTGTGLILDKNAAYVTESLIYGLGIAVVLISILLALVFKSIKMIVIALIPNIIPLLMAASALGYLGIELEAGVSIIFTIIFGIAVDDSIHFLARFRLCLNDGMNKMDAISMTLKECGKAIILTTIVLFFGFLVMMFSSNPPTQTAGILIAFTLVGALVCDLFLLPVLLRKFY